MPLDLIRRAAREARRVSRIADIVKIKRECDFYDVSLDIYDMLIFARDFEKYAETEALQRRPRPHGELGKSLTELPRMLIVTAQASAEAGRQGWSGRQCHENDIDFRRCRRLALCDASLRTTFSSRCEKQFEFNDVLRILSR